MSGCRVKAFTCISWQSHLEGDAPQLYDGLSLGAIVRLHE